jgi:hypothetical protein
MSRLPGPVVYSEIYHGETYTRALKKLNNDAFPKLQFLGKQPGIYGKKRTSDRFFKSLPQNQPGFGKGSSVCPQSRLLCGQTLHLLPFCTKTVRKMPILR